ncbi:MAG: hypothetical protein GX416_01510 [Bacteroidales bacterium]|nr:hypothetical protein [Bacteroidales bacterium]
MKLKIFYSWQSDLPNNTNRQFIMDCLEKAMKTIHQNNLSISDWIIESDSRGESGTPELASTIFSKIDQSDIFIADISIINQGKDFRKICNPNVLIELGYASSKLGWDRILCVYNLAYGQIEDLPFDIRHRKPLTYNLDNKALVKILINQLQSIIDNRISNKLYFTSIKKEIDLSLQAVLIDVSKMLFFRETPKSYDYNLILHSTIDELVVELFERKLLGFQLFKNNTPHLEEFIALYNNQVYLNFLNEKEKHTLAKIILQFKDFNNIINNTEIYNKAGVKKEYCIIDATKMNKENPKDSYILTEKIEGDKHIVLDSGIFKKSKLTDLTNLYQLKSDAVQYVAQKIFELSTEINEWVRITGNYFIVNERLFH